MFKCYDYVVGEIIESENKKVLLEEINERFQSYKKYEDVKNLCVYSINKVYYLINK